MSSKTYLRQCEERNETTSTGDVCYTGPNGVKNGDKATSNPLLTNATEYIEEWNCSVITRKEALDFMLIT
jgi:hypothetical protein